VTPYAGGSGRGGHASLPDVKQVDTTRPMTVLVDDRDSGVGHLHASPSVDLGWEHQGGWNSPRPLKRNPGSSRSPQSYTALTSSPSGTTQADRRWSAFSATDRRRRGSAHGEFLWSLVLSLEGDR